MFELLLALSVGVFIGWHLPQPAWVPAAILKFKTLVHWPAKK